MCTMLPLPTAVATMLVCLACSHANTSSIGPASFGPPLFLLFNEDMFVCVCVLETKTIIGIYLAVMCVCVSFACLLFLYIANNEVKKEEREK